MQRFLEKLRRDKRGNVMFITAASAVVFIGLGGSAVDISRMYLVKNRLQQACDAGVLAYRRSMQGVNVVPGKGGTNETAQAFFKANFGEGKYGSVNVNFPEPTVDANVVVHGTATVTTPMTLMKLFGFPDAQIETKCDAQLQLPNTDVMFVLDTTGSMTETNSGDSESKIVALRKAVTNFYNTLEAAKVAGTQVRYGFVPYSNTVNVGMLLKRDWMVNKATYQSRTFEKQTKDKTGEVAKERTRYSSWSPDAPATTYAGDPENCVAPPSTTKATSNPSSAWTPSDSVVPRSRTNYQTVNGDSYSAQPQSDGTCIITKKTYRQLKQERTETYEAHPNAGDPIYTTKTYWWYEPREFDVSVFKGNAANGLMAGAKADKVFDVNDPSSTDSTKAQYEPFTWNASNACIEERATATANGNTSRSDWDKDIDSIPDPLKPETQWRPFIPNIVFARAVGSYNTTNLDASSWSWSVGRKNYAGNYVRLSSLATLYKGCPSAARKLQTSQAGLTAAALKTYLDGLRTQGWTYHDIGLLWGLRLISREGLFASENTSAPNGSSIGRNIIFMTDGDTDTHIQAYDGYGLSALDRRRTSGQPNDKQQNQIVEDRLSEYCTIAKGQKGITVWVIAFGTNLTPLLENCASEGRAFEARNAIELNDTFAQIAAKIAQLRLTK